MRTLALLLWLPAVALADDLPAGWAAGGTSRDQYDATRNPAGAGGKPSLVLHSRGQLDGAHWGNISSHFSAERYRGKRIRYSAWVRSEGVTGWGGLWMRIDGRHAADKTPQLGFDNMQYRAIKGTTPRTRYEIVLDVPEESEAIYFGFLINGGGTLELDSPNVEVVGNEVRVTSGAHMLSPAPLLDWSQPDTNASAPPLSGHEPIHGSAQEGNRK